MFNWLYRTLKQNKEKFNEGISAFMMGYYLLFIMNYELILIEFDVFMLLMEYANHKRWIKLAILNYILSIKWYYIYI